jgi:acid phosphatase (class A)
VNRKHFLKSIVLFILLLSVPLLSDNIAENNPGYITVGNPDALMLLVPPPDEASAENKADVASTKRISSARTKADVAMAQSQIKLNFFTFAPVIGDWFKAESFPLTADFNKKVEKETKKVYYIAKDHWKRKRPYEVDKTIPVLKKEESFSYPSGHSTRGMVYATVLAEIFPEKKAELLKFGYNIGWYRIIAGVHHPSDVFSGRTIGKAIAREMIKSPKFQEDIEAVKAEIKEKAPK